MNINVIGAGTWGLTLACMLSNKGHDVKIWQRNKKKSNQLQTILKHKNLPGLVIPPNIIFTSNSKCFFK